MVISEIIDIGDIDLLLSIAETCSNSAEHLESSRNQLLKELGETGDNRHIFVGFEDEVAVTMIQIVLKHVDNDPDLANGEDVAHIHNLQVRSDLQGKGIGQQMMAFVEDNARQMGKVTLTLGVDNDNERAIHIYKKLGYEVFKVGPGRTSEEKCLCMRKPL